MNFIIYNKGSWVGFVRVKSDTFLNMTIPMPTGYWSFKFDPCPGKKNQLRTRNKLGYSRKYRNTMQDLVGLVVMGCMPGACFP